jgi:glycosyltransferase involved in cell wall biosynthesis
MFLGRQSRTVVRDLMRRCQAFLFPGLEDFGIAPVEAMSVGRPVIAFAGGGVLDSVVPGVTGALFHQQTVESLMHTLVDFQPQQYSSAACRAQAELFSRERFKQKLLEHLAYTCCKA